jgi:hypothetical protein
LQRPLGDRILSEISIAGHVSGQDRPITAVKSTRLYAHRP